MSTIKSIFAKFLQRLGLLAVETAKEVEALSDVEAPPPMGTMVPLYVYPTAARFLAPAWKAVIDAKLAHPTVPVVAIINPASGAGTKLIPDYQFGIAALKKAGIIVIGYAATKYGARAEVSVQADVDKYRAWYPDVTGVFYDEMNNKAGGEAYYDRLSVHARSKGMTFTVGNPGADTIPSYVGTVDTIMVYESAGTPATAAGWRAVFDKKNFGMLAHGVPTLDPAFVAAARVSANVGYLYVTNDSLVDQDKNPWNSVPPYFGELVALLA